MIRMLKLLGVICGVFSAAGIASAGPIQWSYLANVQPYLWHPGETEQYMLYLGSYTRDGSHGPETVYAYTELPFAPILDGPGLQGNVHDAWIMSVSKDNYELRTTPLPASEVSNYGFQVAWRINDFASGQSGYWMADNFKPVFHWDQAASRGEVGFAWMYGSSDHGPKEQERIGGTIYDFQLGITQSDRDTFLEMDATVTREIPGSPEPGTLILAGMGLTSCGGLWLRRRCA